MLRFLHSFFLSWTSILTVTGWYLLSKQVFPHLVAFGPRDLTASILATQLACAILLTAQIYHCIHVRWIRPRGYVLIREAEYTQLLLLRK